MLAGHVDRAANVAGVGVETTVDKRARAAETTDSIFNLE